ncbi:SREBP regulating gene protein [Stomoxys calcitrans]|uniref:SREBP regulating gene protein n=1 Tax=Stomoxys calcitrans TaxID=35570 RepID=UPI0027E23D2C|nr:SREBP regulating gene protein [Stomoxys calcitrans]
MWPAALTRLLKRRLPHIILVVLFFVYVITKLLERNSHGHILESDDFTAERTKPLIWRTNEEHLLSLNEETLTNRPDIECRNSVQGPYLIVDERGFVCDEFYMLENGCCDVKHYATKYYTCESCDPATHCCGIYEYCVSCCLHPEKRTILELALEVIKGRQAMVYAQVEDQYELCMMKCRTNSHSVEHENRYRDPQHRFCYGPTYAHESQIEVSAMGS